MGVARDLAARFLGGAETEFHVVNGFGLQVQHRPIFVVGILPRANAELCVYHLGNHAFQVFLARVARIYHKRNVELPSLVENNGFLCQYVVKGKLLHKLLFPLGVKTYGGFAFLAQPQHNPRHPSELVANQVSAVVRACRDEIILLVRRHLLVYVAQKRACPETPRRKRAVEVKHGSLAPVESVAHHVAKSLFAVLYFPAPALYAFGTILAGKLGNLVGNAHLRLFGRDYVVVQRLEGKLHGVKDFRQLKKLST